MFEPALQLVCRVHLGAAVAIVAWRRSSVDLRRQARVARRDLQSSNAEEAGGHRCSNQAKHWPHGSAHLHSIGMTQARASAGCCLYATSERSLPTRD